jgi:hypothetical protein
MKTKYDQLCDKYKHLYETTCSPTKLTETLNHIELPNNYTSIDHSDELCEIIKKIHTSCIHFKMSKIQK